MDANWQQIFRNRMHDFQAGREPRPGETAVSIKIRVSSGCFHREHSPRAYEIIDEILSDPTRVASFGFEEHESGPEILAFATLTAAGLSLAASVITLITAIIKARSEGHRKGDHPSEPVEMIVRRIHDAEGFREEKVLRVGHTDAIDETKIAQQLTAALRKLLVERPSPETPAERTAPRGKKKQPRRKKKS